MGQGRVSVAGIVLLALCICVSLRARGAHAATAIILGHSQLETSHSSLIKEVQAQCPDTTVSTALDAAKDERITDRNQYETIVLLASRKAPVKQLSLLGTKLLSFLQRGGNLLLAVDADAAAGLDHLVKELGFKFNTRGLVVDHFSRFNASTVSFGSLYEPDTVIAASPLPLNAFFAGGVPANPIMYAGMAHSVVESSPYILKVLVGPSTAYVVNSSTLADSMGRHALLVSALQAPGNSRFVLSGSLDMFSDSFVSPSGVNTGNMDFFNALFKWTSHRRGALRSSGIFHDLTAKYDQSRKRETSRGRTVYTVGDVISVWMHLHTQDAMSRPQQDSWVPFRRSDVFLELAIAGRVVRRVQMRYNGEGRFAASVRLPSESGVYRITVSHSSARHGFSSLLDLPECTQELIVRPYRHDEYARFLTVALPYYISALSMLVGSFVVGVVVLHS